MIFLVSHLWIGTFLHRYGEERYETREMQLRVRERFSELQKMDEQASSTGPSWHIIDAAQSFEEVQAEIWQVVEKTLGEIGDKPLQKLWEDGYYEPTADVAPTEDEN